jgi:formate hydrogenlyase transcriptional activator
MTSEGAGDDLELLAAGLARARGADLFPVLAQQAARILEAAEVSVCEVAPNNRARTLAVWRAGTIGSNYEYDLAGTPCAGVLTGATLTLTLAPGEFPAVSPRHAGYFGAPLNADNGAVLGHLCAYSERPFDLDGRRRALCDILAKRAAAELRLVHVKRERAVLRAQVRRLRAEVAAEHDTGGIVGASAAHMRLLEEIRRVAPTSAAVLICGEPGVGKELVARAIHAASPRAPKPFVKIDCSAIDIETELLALAQTMAMAHGGTLFLDEVGALSADMQGHLLGALRPAADLRDTSGGDVRIIAASYRDLRQLLRTGEFREDLFYRLNVFPIDVPPLRARVEDIAPLVQFFAHKHARRLCRTLESVDPDSLAELAHYAWPGNVRELANLVERALVVSSAPVLKIAIDTLATTAHAERAALVAAAGGTSTFRRVPISGPVDFDDTLSTGLHVVQREHILRILDSTHWVIEGNSGAAVKLGLKPATLRHRMKKLGISRANSPAAQQRTEP